VILAAELLKRANELVRNKIHPTNIISGYRLAQREVSCRAGAPAALPRNRETRAAVARAGLSACVQQRGRGRRLCPAARSQRLARRGSPCHSACAGRPDHQLLPDLPLAQRVVAEPGWTVQCTHAPPPSRSCMTRRPMPTPAAGLQVHRRAPGAERREAGKGHAAQRCQDLHVLKDRAWRALWGAAASAAAALPSPPLLPASWGAAAAAAWRRWHVEGRCCMLACHALLDTGGGGALWTATHRARSAALPAQLGCMGRPAMPLMLERTGQALLPAAQVGAESDFFAQMVVEAILAVKSTNDAGGLQARLQGRARFQGTQEPQLAAVRGCCQGLLSGAAVRGCCQGLLRLRAARGGHWFSTGTNRGAAQLVTLVLHNWCQQRSTPAACSITPATTCQPGCAAHRPAPSGKHSAAGTRRSQGSLQTLPASCPALQARSGTR
jgi:hypothetical protein